MARGVNRRRFIQLFTRNWISRFQWRRNQRFRRFNKPGHRASRGPKWGHENFTKKCVKWQSCRVHARFSIAGEVIWEHKKHQNPWRLGDPTGGAYTAPQTPGPVAGHPQSPTPLSALRASSFSPWGRTNWGPRSYCWVVVRFRSLSTIGPLVVGANPAKTDKLIEMPFWV